MTERDWKRFISFFIPGLPGPGGSKRAMPVMRKGGIPVLSKTGRPIVNMIDMGGEKTKNWRAVVALSARQEYQGNPIAGPILVTAEFVLPRIGSHFKGKNRTLRDDAPHFHTKTPDVLKLMRSTEDALTGILWLDDSQIADERIRKIYGDKPGAQITVYVLSRADAGEQDTLATPGNGGLF